MTSVHNLRSEQMQPGDVRIDRQTEWGNPFIVGKHGSRDEVIQKFKHLVSQCLQEDRKSGHRMLINKIKSLRGKRLFCWCAPLPCHGDVLKRLADDLNL